MKPSVVLFAGSLLLLSLASCKKTVSYPFNPKELSDSTCQVVYVNYMGGSDATTSLYVREERSESFSLQLSCPAYVGKNGMGKTREGDMKTPVGTFSVLTAFGILPNPGTVLPYVDVDEYTYCCGDSVAYNRIIDIRELPHECTNGEHMIKYGAAYHYGFFPDYNKECELGKGSAIFFHCTGKNPYTAGCIAVPEEEMKAILRALTPGAVLIIAD